MAPWIYLVVSIVGALLSLSARMRMKHLSVLTPLYFLGAWLTGELALHHIAWQGLATLLFAAGGAFDAWPGVLGLAITFASWALLLRVHHDTFAAAPAVAAAFAERSEDAASDIDARALVNPFRFKRSGIERIRNIEYGPSLPGDKGGRNHIDVIRSRTPGERRPVLLQIHGGGWTIGDKREQARPLMTHLAQRGWVCFAPNYRLSPKATWPDHIVDVKRALVWVREHAADYGGDPDFICITGGSAGGHLSALAALTAGDAAFQPGFETADTRVSACVPFYGVYDFTDQLGLRGRSSMEPFLSSTVLKSSLADAREQWEAASPLSRIHSDAPPFLVIHGTHDSLVFVEEARAFVSALREKSANPVVYLEVPRAQHAFDTFHSVRSSHAVHAVTAFLERVYADYCDAGHDGAARPTELGAETLEASA